MVNKLKHIYQQFNLDVKSAIGNRQCYICDQYSRELVCEYCLKSTPISHFPVPGIDLLELESISKHLLTPRYDNLRAICHHDGIIAALINQLKFSNKSIVAPILIEFFNTYVLARLSQLETLPDALIPMPISRLRFTQRQYNQTWLLAKAINQKYGIPIEHAIIRHRHTKQQSRLDRHARLANTMNAFKLVTDIQYKHICIVEDVVTTGATLNNLCECILDHAPNIKISVWCMAVASVD